MSWMPTTAPRSMSSRQASSRSFSRNGSPTCTVGLFWRAASSNPAEAMEAPWMPSRPVGAPTYITGFPAPEAVPRKMASDRMRPAHMTFTRMFPL